MWNRTKYKNDNGKRENEIKLYLSTDIRNQFLAAQQDISRSSDTMHGVIIINIILSYNSLQRESTKQLEYHVMEP